MYEARSEKLRHSLLPHLKLTAYVILGKLLTSLNFDLALELEQCPSNFI